MIVSKQNLRALTKEMFLNLMNEKGLAALEIIRNFNKKEREKMTETNISEKVNNLVSWLNEKYGDDKKSFTVKNGKKYFKICDQENGTIRSVYCFIDPNGNILKANSWNSPHKTPRGTVLEDTNWNKVCFQFGVKYLNGFANY